MGEGREGKGRGKGGCERAEKRRKVAII